MDLSCCLVEVKMPVFFRHPGKLYFRVSLYVTQCGAASRFPAIARKRFRPAVNHSFPGNGCTDYRRHNLKCTVVERASADSHRVSIVEDISAGTDFRNALDGMAIQCGGRTSPTDNLAVEAIFFELTNDFFDLLRDFAKRALLLARRVPNMPGIEHHSAKM